MSLLGLDAWKARYHTYIEEGSQAVRDRMTLAALEWAAEKKRLQALTLLGVAVALIGVLALGMLSLAVLVHFWDTPQRAVVAWVIAGVWLFAWAVAVYALLSALRQQQPLFARTRAELCQDWQEWQAWRNPPPAEKESA